MIRFYPQSVFKEMVWNIIENVWPKLCKHSTLYLQVQILFCIYTHVFASGVSFEKYACSILTDFFIFDGDGSNVLVLDSTNFFSQEIFFLIQFFASVLETVEKPMVLHFCVVDNVNYQVLQ